MSGDSQPIEIPPDVLTRVYEEARKAFPAECCGFIRGPKDQMVANEVHPCANEQDQGNHPAEMAKKRSDETAYVIEGADLLALNRSLDSLTPAKIIYHSHPNGRAYFSQTDQEVATSPWGDGPMYPVVQLVVGIDEGCVRHAKLFAWNEVENTFTEVAEFPGAAI